MSSAMPFGDFFIMGANGKQGNAKSPMSSGGISNLTSPLYLGIVFFISDDIFFLHLSKGYVI